MVLFRRILGDVLRSERMQRGLTLREVSADARVSLGYISEIERGQKEASSELLASLCSALDLPLSDVLREVSDAVAVEELAQGLRRSSPSRPPRSARRVRRPATWSPPPPDRPAGPRQSSGWQRGHQYDARSRSAGPRIATRTGVPHRRQGELSRR